MDTRRRLLVGPVAGTDVRLAQIVLRDMGMDPGRVDGVYGPDTARAIRAFQERRGLPADGVVDGPTWRALGEEPSGKQIGTRSLGHRLHGAVAGDDTLEAQRTLAAIGFDPGRLDGVYGPTTARAVVAFQRSRGLDADGVVGPATWAALDDAAAPPGGRADDAAASPSRDRDAGKRPWAGFSPDGTAGWDLLGRQDTVDLLCSVLAARNLETPLAVGLFGDWGSGKSFFMRLMQDRISELAERSADSELRGEATFYCSHVAQVVVNAWLYADSDIWPSLAAQVFRGVTQAHRDVPLGDQQAAALARFQASAGSDYRYRLDEVRAATTEQDTVERHIQGLTQQIADRHARLVERATTLGPQAAAAAGAAQEAPLVIARLRRLPWAWAGMDRWERLGLAAAVAVGIASAVVTAVRPGWLQAAGALLLPAWAILVLVGRSVRYVDDLATLKQEVGDLEAQRTKLQEEREQQQRRIQEAARQVREFPSLSLLPDVAEHQAQRWAEREQLGVLTEIRRAFEDLSEAISAGRAARAGTATVDRSSAAALPIERVVVYIDDLDRCSPGSVVRVLEAIKLLMDLPNFAVVVGVDSRWLFRSLEVGFSSLLDAQEGASSGAADWWAATPENYLEKIFQYSLVLPPLTAEGYRRLVDSLLQGEAALAAQTPNQEPADSDGTTSPPVGAQEGPAAPPAGRRSAAAADAGPGIDLTPQDLVISAAELSYLRSLAPLFGTPRSVKRLTNLYRLIRVSVGQERVLRDDGYQEVLLLLAVVIAHPSLAATMFRGILAALPDTPWQTFVRRVLLLQEEVGDGSDAAGLKDGTPRQGTTSRARVANFLLDLPAGRSTQLRVDAFKDWVPVVAGFSFQPWHGDAG
jgi:peptidoglycan hydrolase-like protein with peptidoglycan-binding domain